MGGRGTQSVCRILIVSLSCTYQCNHHLNSLQGYTLCVCPFLTVCHLLFSENEKVLHFGRDDKGKLARQVCCMYGPFFHSLPHTHHTELPAKLLDHFLRSNTSNINQNKRTKTNVTHVYSNLQTPPFFLANNHK